MTLTQLNPITVPTTKYEQIATGRIVDVVHVLGKNECNALRNSDWAYVADGKGKPEQQIHILTYPSGVVMFVNHGPVIDGDYVARFDDGTLDHLPEIVLNTMFRLAQVIA